MPPIKGTIPNKYLKKIENKKEEDKEITISFECEGVRTEPIPYKEFLFNSKEIIKRLKKKNI